MTAPEAPDFTLTRLELLDWAQRQAAHIASTLAMAGHCQHCFYFREGHCERWQSDVPERHQSAGCDDWRIDLIPFLGPGFAYDLAGYLHPGGPAFCPLGLSHQWS
jgi:hypothetical protein